MLFGKPAGVSYENDNLNLTILRPYPWARFAYIKAYKGILDGTAPEEVDLISINSQPLDTNTYPHQTMNGPNSYFLIILGR